MEKSIPVLIPLVNPNENESLLARICVKEGQKVIAGELIAVFETTKSTLELTADQAGFVRDICLKEGDSVNTGERLCYLTKTPDSPLPKEDSPKPVISSEAIHSKTDGLRITQPARALALELGVDILGFPSDVLITEQMVREKLQQKSSTADPLTLIIYGGGGHAKSLIELIQAEGKYKIAGILDDNLSPFSTVLGIPVLGGGEKLIELYQGGIQQAINAVGGIGNITPRLSIFERMKMIGFSFPTVIHPRAFVEPTAKVSAGSQLFFNAYVGSDVTVGFGSIINTGAIISHDCVLADFVNISPGAILAGGVVVGERVLIGMGVTINLNVKIGAGARIGNSAVVKADVPENGVVRAGTTWPGLTEA
jgi:acetyltransferase EpsM